MIQGTPTAMKVGDFQKKKLSEAGKLLDITVVDHLMITDDHFYSFADHALMS